MLTRSILDLHEEKLASHRTGLMGLISVASLKPLQEVGIASPRRPGRGPLHADLAFLHPAAGKSPLLWRLAVCQCYAIHSFSPQTAGATHALTSQAFDPSWGPPALSSPSPDWPPWIQFDREVWHELLVWMTRSRLRWDWLHRRLPPPQPQRRVTSLQCQLCRRR